MKARQSDYKGFHLSLFRLFPYKKKWVNSVHTLSIFYVKIYDVYHTSFLHNVYAHQILQD